METVSIGLDFNIRNEKGQFGRVPNIGLAKSEFAKSFFMDTIIVLLIPFHRIIVKDTMHRCFKFTA